MEKIVILSEHFGSGHTRAAESLAKGLKELDMELSPIVIEPGSKSHPLIFKRVSAIYSSILRYSPSVWGYAYESNREKDLQEIYGSLFRIQEKIIKNTYIDSLIQGIGDSTTVVCTHPLPVQGMAYLKKLGWEGKLAAFITDYDFHGAWFHPAVDKYFFGGDAIPSSFPFNVGNKLVSTSIPIDTEFWKPIEKEDAKLKLGISSKEAFLVMGGGWGLGINSRLFNELTKLPDYTDVIIVTGINNKLFDKLQKRITELDLKNFQIKGFVKNIQDYMQACDVLITKPGALTCSEALTLGLPTILINPLPGQEERNCQYLSNKYPTIKYLDDYSKLLTYIEQIKKPLFKVLDPTNASKEVIKFHRVG